MATKPLKKDATYADLYDVPEHFVAEIFDGELYASPRPALPHAHAASVLGTKLGEPFHRSGPGGWVILDEPELHFGNDVLVPDLAGWRRERLPTVPAAAYMTLAPDWVCEVLSPSTEPLVGARSCASTRAKASRTPGSWTRSNARSRCCRSSWDDGSRSRRTRASLESVYRRSMRSSSSSARFGSSGRMADAANAPMGANLAESGATFRVWDPTSTGVAVRGDFNGWTDQPLDKSASGHWSKFVPGVQEGDEYKFFVTGVGSTGYKRDPYARELTRAPAFPHSNCIVTQPRSFPWHDARLSSSGLQRARAVSAARRRVLCDGRAGHATCAGHAPDASSMFSSRSTIS